MDLAPTAQSRPHVVTDYSDSALKMRNLYSILPKMVSLFSCWYTTAVSNVEAQAIQKERDPNGSIRWC